MPDITAEVTAGTDRPGCCPIMKHQVYHREELATVTAVSQVKLWRPLTEHHFNGILRARHIKAGGRTGKWLFLEEIMRSFDV